MYPYPIMLQTVVAVVMSGIGTDETNPLMFINTMPSFAYPSLLYRLNSKPKIANKAQTQKLF